MYVGSYINFVNQIYPIFKSSVAPYSKWFLIILIRRLPDKLDLVHTIPEL